ncbi:MAG: deoxyguanosinetriphosphate triphosphohydrolase [Lachnospiraceae bacterium]|nr:deoxyguanosinetriphosphate triphosphohydrolase [Lachnospiraceae bacterium]
MNWNDLLSGERIRKYTKSTTSRDLRTEFEKDYHRIIGSASFRRLQDKTQVFPLDKNDFIRTRLTHSLEVSSFARSLAQNVGERIVSEGLDKDFDNSKKEDICAILQCAGLIHDIGNPPFGHFGENTTREWCKNNFDRLYFKGRKITEILNDQMIADFYNFEGNTQALRVVSKLHFLVDEHGMNLTKALLGTIIKYPVSSLEIGRYPGDIRCKKMGYFYADKDIYEEIDRTLGTNGCRHPLTFLLEAADDIAYKTADIEDSINKGCILYTQLVQELMDYGDQHDCSTLFYKIIDILKHKYEKANENNISQPDIYAVKNWIISIQGYLLFAATDSFIDHYSEIMTGTYKKDLFYGTEVQDIMYILGDIAYRYAFISRPIHKLEIAADSIFNNLYEKFINAIINFDTDEENSIVNKKIVSLISEDYKRIYYIYSKDRPEEEKLYLRLLLVTDYICGMTDSFAKNLYQELNGVV